MSAGLTQLERLVSPPNRRGQKRDVDAVRFLEQFAHHALG
jgi:hypothetical protein